VFKTSFTSFWLKDVEFVILSSELKDQDLKTTSNKPDRTRPLWEEKLLFSFQGGRVLEANLCQKKEVKKFFWSAKRTSLREKLSPCSVRRKGVLPERNISI